MTWTPTIENGRAYLGERTGKYEYRAVRYRRAVEEMWIRGLENWQSVVDIGAGATEFDYCLRAEYDWDGVYVPVDCAIDGTDLNKWVPPRDYDWFVALEILEHLDYWWWLVRNMQRSATRGIVVSTPNPRTTDVLGMDRTHVVAIDQEMLEAKGFQVWETTFYGGVWSGGAPDSLFGVWTP